MRIRNKKRKRDDVYISPVIADNLSKLRNDRESLTECVKRFIIPRYTVPEKKLCPQRFAGIIFFCYPRVFGFCNIFTFVKPKSAYLFL